MGMALEVTKELPHSCGARDYPWCPVTAGWVRKTETQWSCLQTYRMKLCLQENGCNSLAEEHGNVASYLQFLKFIEVVGSGTTKDRK